MEDRTINLCDTCQFSYPTCDATGEIADGGSIEFGNGLGFDNVFKCKCYQEG